MIQSFVVFKGKYKHIEIEFNNQYGEISVIQEAVSISRKNLFSTKWKTQVILIRKTVDYVERSYIVILKRKYVYYYGICLFTGKEYVSNIQKLVDTCLNSDFEKIMSKRPFFKSLHYPNTRTEIQKYQDDKIKTIERLLRPLPAFKGIDDKAILYCVDSLRDENLKYYRNIVCKVSNRQQNNNTKVISTINEYIIDVKKRGKAVLNQLRDKIWYLWTIHIEDRLKTVAKILLAFLILGVIGILFMIVRERFFVNNYNEGYYEDETNITTESTLQVPDDFVFIPSDTLYSYQDGAFIKLYL